MILGAVQVYQGTIMDKHAPTSEDTWITQPHQQDGLLAVLVTLHPITATSTVEDQMMEFDLLLPSASRNRQIPRLHLQVAKTNVKQTGLQRVLLIVSKTLPAKQLVTPEHAPLNRTR